ncbi:endonuclease domain-containing protein [Gandjariella thermophila]|uniref:DUF559 domain-containing protein n=1 Tax=Gandjariella thermophila TaxID=1931992 RepID=A0A4D4JD87_9PSEU|nr:DUF559 domain-containing protein [Gandjariella thermophila]GDY32618.1 hypothetical protein GTS_42510 [Gandjariella thermophila]
MPGELHGLFRGTAAVAAGVLRPDQLRSTSFRRLFRDVYWPAWLPVTHPIRCRAAALIAPESAVLTGRSAATVLGVPLAATHDPVELLVPEADRFGPVRGTRIRRGPVPPVDHLPWDRIRIAASERMAFDVVARANLRRAVAELDQLIRHDVVDLEAFRGWLRGCHLHGVVRARRAAELADPRAESPPESEVRVLLRLAGLRPVPQLCVWDEHGLVGRVDLGFEEHRVAVEYDGEWHAAADRFARDRERLNRLQAAGWEVVFVTKALLREDPRAVVAAVQAALRRARTRLQRARRGVEDSQIPR